MFRARAARKEPKSKQIVVDRRIVMNLSHLKTWACAASVVAVAALSAQAQGNHFNTPGNVLISDQYNNRLIEVNPNNHRIVWSFGNGSSVAGPHSVVGVNDAQRIGPITLVAGTGVPAGAEPNCPNGCPDNRVMLVDPAGNIFWQYGKAGVTGSGPDQLNVPVQNTWLPNTHILITDQGNMRVIEVNLEKKIVWQYGQTGVAGDGPDQLNNPNSAELLANGDILIADESNNRVIEVNRKHQIVWSYGSADGTQLNAAAFASRLPDGTTLITDGGNNRIVDVDSGGNVVWTYYTNARMGSISNPAPSRAVMLKNGNVLISDQNNMQVFEIDPSQNVVFVQGTIAVAGATFDMLNGPYDAKVIGDYTGLTPPF
jgi:outer membrane protein assembly factor BamB